MSLIKCPECNKEVSSKAPTCPYCGVTIAGNVKRCPVCGAFALMDAPACPQCATQFLVPGSTPAPAAPHQPAAEPAPQAAQTAPPQAADPQPQAGHPAASGGQAAQPEAPGPEDDASQPAGPGAQERKGGGVPWWVLVLCIAAVCAGGFFYWERTNREASEERAFQLLQDCTDPLNYEDFIARFPKSSHIQDVRSRLAELQRIDQAWEEIVRSQRVEDLEAFVRSNPHSPNKKVALHKIDSLDWRAADKRGTSEAYDAYIAKHDNGEYITQAYTSRDAARRREEQARRDSVAAAAELQADSARALAGESPAASAEALAQ